MLNYEDGETFTKELPCELTAEEHEARSQMLLETCKNEAETLEEYDDVKKSYRARLNTIQSEKAKLVEALDTGIEKRPVDCIARREDKLGELRIVRLDTEDVIDARPLTAEERQMGMFEGGEDEERHDHDDSHDPNEGFEPEPEPEPAPAEA